MMKHLSERLRDHTKIQTWTSVILLLAMATLMWLIYFVTVDFTGMHEAWYRRHKLDLVTVEIYIVSALFCLLSVMMSYFTWQVLRATNLLIATIG